MNQPSIRIDGLGKRYRVGVAGAGTGYATLRESLTHLASAPWRRLRGRGDGAPAKEFWALRDVSFAVQPGEVVGIIGRNGAGKSTLLKVLSRITKPTTGQVELRGRISSLLEVGTGFHPELTGRENIYLNGAILGMHRREIDRKFDAIVAFSEIEEFLETPVKRYSSGMYVRLAFAVASHLEPEVLVVDEVLAVGDAAFQKKCLGKMDDISRGSRTVFFVSHNMGAIKALCTRAVLMDAGRVVADGPVDAVADQYFNVGNVSYGDGLVPDETPRSGTGQARVRSVRLMDPRGAETSQLYLGQPFRVALECEALSPIRDAVVEVSVSTLDGTQVTCATTMDGGGAPFPLAVGTHAIAVDFDLVLLPRRYTLTIGVHHGGGLTIDFLERTIDFTVLHVAENGPDMHPWSRVRGFVRPSARWRLPGRAVPATGPSE